MNVTEQYKNLCDLCEIPVRDALKYKLTIKDLEELDAQNERLKPNHLRMSSVFTPSDEQDLYPYD